MKTNEVPQEAVRTYAGNRKLLYAVDDTGQYTSVVSSGWQVEAQATEAAICEYDQLAEQAWQQAKDGLCSPLAYHMYVCRMDEPLLAQVTGLWRWRIRRHMQPHRFAKLSSALLQRYADALGISAQQLAQLPQAPYKHRE